MYQQINPILQPYVSEPFLFDLLDACVGRLLRRKGEALDIEAEELRHIADWLRAALVNDDPWLKNVDGQGRPKKLLKFGSIDAISREANKAMLKAAQKLRGVKLVDGDEALHAELADDYRLVRLLTPAALDRDSSEMQHCIGNGGFDESLNDDRYLYLSLRDPHGKAHATMEIEDGRIVELQGKQNRPPIQKYIDLLIPYVRASGLVIQIRPSHLGHVIDDEGAWHPINNLPDRLKVSGNLDLSGTAITALPENLSVGGSLSVRGTRITVLPKGLSVGRSLYLTGTKLVALPEGLSVNGDLFLNDTLITALPKDLMVGGSLHLYATKVTALPEGLTVGEDLYLNNTPVHELPDNLSVGRDLTLVEANFTALPKGLRVGRDLNVINSQIIALPDDLTVDGGLVLSNTPVASLPKGLTVGTELYIEETQITALPDDISVGGDIFLNDTLITAVPDSFHDDKKLYFGNTIILTAKEFRSTMMRKGKQTSKPSMALGSALP